jgi:hypothetical protein
MKMKMMNKDTVSFFALKHAIDDQVARLDWSTERCIVYIKDRYGVRSRLAMTDMQLQHLLQTLSNMPDPVIRDKSNKRTDRRRKRRSIS